MRYFGRKRDVLIVPHHNDSEPHEHRQSHPHHGAESRYLQLNTNEKTEHQSHRFDGQTKEGFDADEYIADMYTPPTLTLEVSEITALQSKIKNYTRKIKKEHKQQKQLRAALQRIEEQDVKIQQLKDTIARKDHLINKLLTSIQRLQLEHEQQSNELPSHDTSENAPAVADGSSNNSNNEDPTTAKASTSSTSMSSTMKEKQQQYQNEHEEFTKKRATLRSKRDCMQLKMEQVVLNLLSNSRLSSSSSPQSNFEAMGCVFQSSVI